MCEALRELMAPEFDHSIKETTERVTREVTEEVTKEVTKEVTEEGIKIFIIDSVEEGRSEQVTVNKLIRHYHLDENTAKDYFAKYSSVKV